MAPEDGSKVHISAVEHAGLGTLREAQRLKCEVRPGRDGRTAAEELSATDQGGQAVIRIADNAGGRDFVAGDIHGRYRIFERASTTLTSTRGRSHLFTVEDLTVARRGASCRAPGSPSTTRDSPRRRSVHPRTCRLEGGWRSSRAAAAAWSPGVAAPQLRHRTVLALAGVFRDPRFRALSGAASKIPEKHQYLEIPESPAITMDPRKSIHP